jgi:mRNA interferase MazF
MRRSLPNPKRGEVWIYAPGRSLGSEMRKDRRGVVVSSDSIRSLDIRLVVPLTEWSDNFQNQDWHVKLEPDAYNGLTKLSAADVMQLRCLTLERFKVKAGQVSANDLEEIVTSVAVVIEYR